MLAICTSGRCPCPSGALPHERLFAAAVTLLRPGDGDWEKLRACCPGAGASVTASGNGRSGQAAGA